MLKLGLLLLRLQSYQRLAGQNITLHASPSARNSTVHLLPAVGIVNTEIRVPSAENQLCTTALNGHDHGTPNYKDRFQELHPLHRCKKERKKEREEKKTEKKTTDLGTFNTEIKISSLENQG